MNRILSLLLALWATLCICAQPWTDRAVVKPGIEVLRDHGFRELEGLRVGLITNPTGIDNDFRTTVQILMEAANVKLVSLFAPEHGIYGDAHQGVRSTEKFDSISGLPIHSLYGRSLKPTPEMLKGLDAVVYDIQDNGCRSFTYISTMGRAMEACAENKVRFVVLDRPNPLGGERVEGCIAQPDVMSMVSRYRIPYLYGLTPGELAMALNDMRLLDNGVQCDLKVVPMEGWRRKMLFCETGMPFVMPSAHIPNAETYNYYPATGILGELYYVSNGVGYTLPFQLVGASWIRAHEFADAMNALNLPGVMWRPFFYQPFFSTSKGEYIQGCQLYIDPHTTTSLTMIQFYAMQELARLYPAHKVLSPTAAPKRYAMFDSVCGTRSIRARFATQYRVEDILPTWNKGVEEWKEKTEKYKLYD